MIIRLDMASEVPIYVQLRNAVVVGIGKGELQPGEGLPTVRQMAEDLGVNTMTVNKAYGILKNEGFGNETLYNGILAHNPLNGYIAKSDMEICILSADPMSGFIMGIAKGYPDKKLRSVKVSSILKRFKEARYCRSANREYMSAIEKLGLSLEEFSTLALEALCEIDERLGL